MRKKYIILMVTLALSVALLLVSASASSRFVEYSPARVELKGTIYLESLYGPPNFGDTPELDRKRSAAVLILDAPVSVRGRPGDQMNSQAFDNVLRVQLEAPAGLYPVDYKERHVVVMGTLREAHDASKITDVFLRVEKISVLR